MSARFNSRSIWPSLQVALLGANLAWTTLCLGGYLAKTMVVTVALTAALLLVHATAWVLDADSIGPDDADAATAPRRFRWPHPAGWLFLPFLAYAAANVHWVTPVRWLGWIDWFNWAQMIAVFWVVLNGVRSRSAQKALLGVLASIAVVSVLLACYQRFVRPDWLMLGRTQVEQYVGRASGPFGIPNSLAALLLLLLPVLGALTCRRRTTPTLRVLFGWVTLVLLFGLGLTISRGAWLGLAVALTLWPLFRPGATWRRRVAIAGCVCAAIALVGAGTYAASANVRDRFTRLVREAGERSRPILWRATLGIFRAHPVVGSGGGSFDVEFEPYRPEGFVLDPIWAHNDYLNTMSDYGAVGFGLFFGAAAVTGWNCRRRGRAHRGADVAARAKPLGGMEPGTPPVRFAARPVMGGEDLLDEPLVRQALAVGVVAFALQLCVDFHFKIPALAMAFATVAGILVRRAWVFEGATARRAPSFATAAGVAALAVTIMIAIWPLYRGEAARQQGRRRIDHLFDVPVTSPKFATELGKADAELAKAVTCAPGNAQAWADRAYVAAQQSLVEPRRMVELGREGMGFADKAIGLAPLVPEYWVRRGVARDLQGDWTGAGDDFVKAISLSPKTVLPTYHYAYHLALRPSMRGLAEALVAFCLRLDPGNRDAQRLRQQLATGRTGP